MTVADKWNKIVEIYGKHINCKEDVIQNLWENIFIEFFGFSRFNGDIDRHRNIQIGSTERIITDIIVKEGNADLFIVELKQHNLPKSKSMELQLISYLKQLRLDIGILVCDKIYVYDYDYSKADNEQRCAEIEFMQDSIDGERFIEMFSKGCFEKVAVIDFIRLQNEAIKKVANIKEELTTDLTLKLIKDYFVEKYSESVFDKAIADYDITVAQKNTFTSNRIVPPIATMDLVTKTPNPNVDMHRRGNPTQRFSIGGMSCDKNAFEHHLRNHESSIVEVTLFYNDQRQEQKIWRVNNFGPHSNLSGNIASGFLRDWRTKGIVAIELKV